MLSFPLIARELRIQARKRATYDVRLGWGLAAFGALALFVWNLPQYTWNGRYLFSVIHGCLALMLFFFAPIGAADAISREKREGTLGLLLLTKLTPTQVVLGKQAAHLVRLFYFALMMLPFLAIPAVMGGVEFYDFLLSVVILFAIAAAGVSAGLIASALCLNFGAALAWAMILGPLLTLAASSLVVNILFGYFPTIRGGMPVGFKIFGLGPLLLLFPVQAREISGMLIASRWLFLYIEIGLILLSVFFLRISVLIAARKIAQHAESASETKRQAVFREKFLTPRFWRSSYRRMMSRRLDRNPLIWLEYRTAWARSVRLALTLLVVVIEVLLLKSSPHREEFIGAHFMMLFLLTIFLTFKTSTSFHLEKETGAFELLLVTPLTETKLLQARLRAVASYYAPILAAIVLFGLFGLAWTSPMAYGEPNRLSAAVNFVSITCSFVSVPFCGLFFALRFRSVLPALLGTGGLAVFAPVCTWIAFNGLLWMAAGRRSPLFAALMYDGLQKHWWPALLGMALYHAVIATVCGHAAIKLLRERQFSQI